ncbi:MAG: HipA family kinase [Bacteroidota bacterium]
MIQTLNTIHTPDKIFPTGKTPLLVTCDDLQSWVCKHSAHTSILTNELIGSCFANLWGLRTPDISFIHVNENHIPQGFSNSNFEKPCFGSKYIQTSIELNDSILHLFEEGSFRRKIINKNDLLMISLFDIWLSNEDRNHNNSNLLIDLTDSEKYYFTVFDHDSIFNSNSLNHGLFQINDFESLINTNLANILFKKGSNLIKVVDNLVEKFYFCTSTCENSIQNILFSIPQEWGINIDTLEKQLRNNLFTQKWLEDCENNFRAMIQKHIK